MSDTIITVAEQAVYVNVSDYNNNLILSQVGTQGPSGPVADISSGIALLSGQLASQFYQSSSEQVYQFLLPTGIDQMTILFNQSFTTAPMIIPSFQVPTNVIYTAVSTKASITGVKVFFSDNIYETGVYLNVLAKLID